MKTQIKFSIQDAVYSMVGFALFGILMVTMIAPNFDTAYGYSITGLSTTITQGLLLLCLFLFLIGFALKYLPKKKIAFGYKPSIEISIDEIIHGSIAFGIAILLLATIALPYFNNSYNYAFSNLTGSNLTLFKGVLSLVFVLVVISFGLKYIPRKGK